MIETIAIKDLWSEQRTFLARAIAAAIIAVLLVAVVVARLVNLQVVNYQHFTDLSQGNRIRIEPLPPTRGLIYDRHGRTLAENLPAYQLELTREQVPDLEDTFSRLVTLGLVAEQDLDTIRQRLRTRRGFEPFTLRYQLDDTEVAKFAVHRQNFPGVDIRARLIRRYPQGPVSAHALGYVGSISEADLKRLDMASYAGTSHVGKLGIENAREDALHGQVGYQQTLVNAQGRALQHIPEQLPVAGRDIISTLDIDLQIAAFEALGQHHGAVVAIDPRNGDVLAMASTPSYDPNDITQGLSEADYQALQNDPGKPLFNRALRGQYPPGSTIKPIVAMAALHYLGQDPQQKHICPGFFMLPDSSHRYRDWKKEGHGRVDMVDAITQSCDVYFYEIAIDVGIDRLHEFLSLFNLGIPTGIDIPGEKAGLMPSRAYKKAAFNRREDQAWYPGETVIAGIGQGYMQATPLQLAQAAAIIASRGKPFRPRLVAGTRDPLSGEITEAPPQPLPELPVGNVDYWRIIQGAMENVMHNERGTARGSAMGASYRYAGKTGTAQVFGIAQDQEYEEEEVPEHLRHHALFIAYAPAQAPEIALAVVVENGGSGSRAAAPVARKVLDAYMQEHAP